jgi:hypothetical protein
MCLWMGEYSIKIQMTFLVVKILSSDLTRPTELRNWGALWFTGECGASREFWLFRGNTNPLCLTVCFIFCLKLHETCDKRCRSIGDVTLQPYISCEPEIIEKQIEPDDEYLVMASDGVFDVMGNDDVAKIILRNAKDFLNVSKRLCTEAIIMGSSDNVTALVIDLKYVCCSVLYITTLRLFARFKLLS